MPRVRLISNFGAIPAGSSGLTLGSPTSDGYVRVGFDHNPRCQRINQVNIAVPLRLLQNGGCAEVLSARDVAEQEGVSISTIYRWIASGEIMSEKISGRHVILRKDLS